MSSIPSITVPVRLLMDHGVDVNLCSLYFGQTMLHAATISDDTDMVSDLLKLGADPNIRSSLHETPLEMAKKYPSFANHKRIVELLLEHGATDDTSPSG